MPKARGRGEPLAAASYCPVGADVSRLKEQAVGKHFARMSVQEAVATDTEQYGDRRSSKRLQVLQLYLLTRLYTPDSEGLLGTKFGATPPKFGWRPLPRCFLRAPGFAV
jgi:hypothetical protein